MNEVVVDTGAMRSHASAVDGIAARLAEAADASATMAIPDMAFGLLCSFLVPPAMLVQTLAAGTVSGAASAMEGISSSITGAAEAYDAIDHFVQDSLSKITKAMR